MMPLVMFALLTATFRCCKGIPVVMPKLPMNPMNRMPVVTEHTHDVSI
jgi:hypothetical protein